MKIRIIVPADNKTLASIAIKQWNPNHETSLVLLDTIPLIAGSLEPDNYRVKDIGSSLHHKLKIMNFQL